MKLSVSPRFVPDPGKIETFEDFERAVNRHDLTYMMSDDHGVYRAGAASEDRIREASKRFPREDVERVWNAMVDKSIKAPYATDWYWRWRD